MRRLISTAVNQETGERLSPRTPIDREEFPLKGSLISQLLLRLKAEGKLRAIAPLANREGCVNTISTLVGELQRAGKMPVEFAGIVGNRVQDAAEQGSSKREIPRNMSAPDSDGERSRLPHSQIDFDRDVSLVYSTYASLLAENNLTEGDADGLRALQILRGDIEGLPGPVRLPWLETCACWCSTGSSISPLLRASC